MASHERVDAIDLREPIPADGRALWQLARDTGLDLNSPYAYLLVASHWAPTSVIAERGGRAVGFVSGYRPPTDAGAWFCWQVGVSEQARGCGLARRMMLHILGRSACDFLRAGRKRDMAKAQVAQLEEMAEAGSWEWDVRADTLRWSPELSRIYGLRPGEAPGGYDGFLQRVYPADREHTEQIVGCAFEQKRDVEYQHRIVRTDGRVRVLRSLVHVEQDTDGEVVRLAGTCQDVTDRVEMKERLRRLRSLASAGSVAAGLSHDLNNMVGAMVLLCGSLSRNGNGDCPKARARLIDKIQQVAMQTSTIASRIHQLARESQSEPPPLALERELARIAAVLRDILPDSINLELDVRPGIGSVRLDPLDLERVLWNLAINARDAQPTGGIVEVAVDRVSVIGHGRECDYCRICIRDEGVGMDDRTAARLFEPFFTTKGDNGNGIGLAVVHDIVEAAGGFVTVDSRRGEGTRIRVHLPVAD